MFAFIDIEVGFNSKKVYDYGAVKETGAVLHTHSASEFTAFIVDCDTLCGHNILNHDLKYLNLSQNYIFIDTLPLSPLLFPCKPYHKLLKDDKLQVDELNNPVNGKIESRDEWTGKMIYQRGQDPILKNRENIKDEFGNLIGYRVYHEDLKKWVVYDNQHQQIGYYYWDTFKNTWTYHTGRAY